MGRDDAAFLARARVVFDAALQLPPGDRGALLRRECCGDENLRALLEQQLALLERGETSFLADVRCATALVEQPARIGPHRVIALLGEGGMGTVYLAEQQTPVRRRVALKVIKLGMDSMSVVARFEQERQALAVMNHDNIAKVYDAGTTERGQAYLVMELVDGAPITLYCDEHRLTIHERIQLFRQACAGAQHAHQKGVIHRDLKPSNILVSGGERAAAKIIDFGVARAVERPAEDLGPPTELGAVIGTPSFMSPEQARGGVIDTRTDVYSLGVLLHELLCGQRPVPADRELPRPSHSLHSAASIEVIAASRRLTPRALSRLLRGDLDWIVQRAMAVNPDHRYESAAALSQDLASAMLYGPIQAGPPSLRHRLRRALRRYRVQATVASSTFLALAAGLVASLLFYFEAVEAKVKLDPLVLVGLHEQALDELWPADPENIARFQGWLRSASQLSMRLDQQRARLRELQAGGPGGLAVQGGLSELETQARFVRDLEALVDGEPTAKNVRGVQQRLQWAERVFDLTVQRHGEQWQLARAAISLADGVAASVLYKAVPIELEPQVGLIPLGPDPATGLWQFYHLRSAWDPGSDVDPAAIPLPTIGADGRVEMTDDTGIILVLLPGGAFEMGASTERDQWVRMEEQPPCMVQLAPFFMARHEMTQAQWRRLTGTTPSFMQPGSGAFPIRGTNPVENLAWTEALRGLRFFGLTLPTEAQWEYAARGGTTSIWSTSNDLAGLDRTANLADRHAQANGGSPGLNYELALDDSWTWHAPVGTYAPNPFGLYDAHGNVWEWCMDLYHLPSHSPDPGSGIRQGSPANSSRMQRGGSFASHPYDARCARRFSAAPETRELDVGVRAARALFPK